MKILLASAKDKYIRSFTFSRKGPILFPEFEFVREFMASVKKKRRAKIARHKRKKRRRRDRHKKK
jgi:hypothetical protein